MCTTFSDFINFISINDENESNFGERFSANETIGTFVDVSNELNPIYRNHHRKTKKFLQPAKVNKSLEKNNEDSNKTSQFPDIEKCLPRWKEVFTWVCWCPEDCTLFCLQCREILSQNFPSKLERSNVIKLVSSDKIFTVSKELRAHHNSPAHVSAIYLHSFGNLLSFISLFNNHYNDLKHENDVLEAVRSLFNYSNIQKETFVKAMKYIGQYVQSTLVDSVKSSKYFSVVADQCRGILILRWVTVEGEIVEHVFWSYLLEWKMTPMQYLKQFGLNFDKMTLYIANTLCQQCQRCQDISVMPASLPPRPPSTLSFANILWNLDFLRPLSSLIITLQKLVRVYPYKFSKIFTANELKNLFTFKIKPISLIKIMENYDEIKKIAFEIYECRSYVEALGLATVELKSDARHKKILTLLQEIIDVVKEASLCIKISDAQIVKLNQAFSSLKAASGGANFVSHHSQDQLINAKPDKIWEFVYFVEKFIDENQKTIYYNGRDRVGAFMDICCSKVLTDNTGKQIDDEKLNKSFTIVYDVYIQVLNSTNTFNRIRILKSVKNFHSYALENNLNVNTCADILLAFQNIKSLVTDFPDAFEMFLFCATMPFQTCVVARSLFVSFVVEQRLESSIWTKMNAEMKPWLLYLQHELSFILPESLLSWWLDSLP